MHPARGASKRGRQHNNRGRGRGRDAHSSAPASGAPSPLSFVHTGYHPDPQQQLWLNAVDRRDAAVLRQLATGQGKAMVYDAFFEMPIKSQKGPGQVQKWGLGNCSQYVVANNMQSLVYLLIEVGVDFSRLPKNVPGYDVVRRSALHMVTNSGPTSSMGGSDMRSAAKTTSTTPPATPGSSASPTSASSPAQPSTSSRPTSSPAQPSTSSRPAPISTQPAPAPAPSRSPAESALPKVEKKLREREKEIEALRAELAQSKSNLKEACDTAKAATDAAKAATDAAERAAAEAAERIQAAERAAAGATAKPSPSKQAKRADKELKEMQARHAREIESMTQTLQERNIQISQLQAGIESKDALNENANLAMGEVRMQLEATQQLVSQLTMELKDARIQATRLMPILLESRDIIFAVNGVEPVAQSSFGRLYRVKLKGHGDVAIKVKDGTALTTNDLVRTLAMVSGLRHPHIAVLRAACIHERCRALVYAAPGKPVNDLLDTLSQQERLLVAVGLARALSHIHALGYVHTAISSAAVYFDQAAQTAVLGDADCARQVSDVAALVDAIGMAQYVDPQVYMTGQYLPESDVYSFGVVLAELLTGRSMILSTRKGNTVHLLRDFRSGSELVKRAHKVWTNVPARALSITIEMCVAADLSLRHPILDTKESLEVLAGLRKGQNEVPVRECAICLDDVIGGHFTPCGHSCACKACGDAILADKAVCPICYEPVTGFVEE